MHDEGGAGEADLHWRAVAAERDRRAPVGQPLRRTVGAQRQAQHATGGRILEAEASLDEGDRRGRGGDRACRSLRARFERQYAIAGLAELAPQFGAQLAAQISQVGAR
ncbi:MAG: hypothetical protein KJZ83_13520 [Burkholderiaceae bacterium]|nr:hypothetical protein [Burkholderiaceae bacterium]